MTDFYSSLLSDFTAVAENNTTYSYLTERHIQAIWMEQKYFRNLKTYDGKDVVVISPGIWNGEAGPDFLKAHLLINGKEVQGDIELHLDDESWMQHGHNKDSRYNNVVLHLSLWEPLKQMELQKENEEKIPQAYLDPFLTIPHARLARIIDLDLYPYKKFIGSGRCAQQLFRTLPEQNVRTLFSSAALYRLVKKYDRLALYAIPELVLGAGVAMALGYKHNAQSFLELFLILVNSNEKDETRLFATALGLCGFFEAKFSDRWAESEKYQELKKIWMSLGNDVRYTLALHQIRPYNHPIRRLFLLCKWIVNTDFQDIQSQLIRIWRTSFPSCKTNKDFKQLFQELIALIPNFEDSYWNHHFTFEKESKEAYLPLTGSDLKEEIVINTFLPILYHSLKSNGDIDELNTFSTFYSTLRTAQSGKTRYLTHRFFGDTPKGTVLTKRKMEQGAFQIHRDFCLHFEASCEGCPFIQRYQEETKIRFAENHPKSSDLASLSFATII